MPTQSSYFSSGISRSEIVGNQNTVADISGVNLQRKRGAAVQNRKMDKLIQISNISPVAVVAETLNTSLIFTSDRKVYRNNGTSIAQIGTINAYNGIDIFTFAAVSDITLHDRVFAALDAVDNQIIFGDVREDGKESRVVLDETITMLPTPTTGYRACGMNSSHIYLLDGINKITRFRLGTDGRIAQATGTDTTLPSYSAGNPIGIAVNTNGVVVLYSNKFLRTGTFDASGEITFNGTLVDLSATDGAINGIGATTSNLALAQSDNIIIIPIADANMTLTTASASAKSNADTSRTNRSVGIQGNTIMTLSGTSVLFGTLLPDGVLDETLVEDVQDAIQYGDYIYYATTHSLGRWKIGEDLSTRQDSYKFFLNGHDTFHPMFKLFDSLFIGDHHVIAQQRGDDTFIRKALDIFPEFTIRCLGQIQNNLLIGTQGTAVSSYGSSQVFIWDTFNDSWTSSTLIPEDRITAFVNTGLFTVIVAGEEANMYYFDGYNSRLLQSIGSGTLEVLPRHVVQFQGQTYVARGNRIYSIYGTFIQAGNQGGANSILCGEYMLNNTTEQSTNIQIMSVFKDKLSCMRPNGFFTLSDNLYEDIVFTTRVAVSNSEIAPEPKVFMVNFLTPPVNGTVSVTQITNDGDKLLDGQFSKDGKTYVAKGARQSRTIQFTCRIEGRDSREIELLSSILVY